ncbi:MAG: aspartate dehydrogenase domain-containing protein [Candidatus Omnitrophota bacterium]|jgi:aspartate dehydrogenase
MKNKLKIGIVGCGAIGTSLAREISGPLSGQAKLAGLFDIDLAKSSRLARLLSGKKGLCAVSLAALIKRSDLVIEASAAKSSYLIAKTVLQAGRSVMIMSVGGVAEHIKQLIFLAKKNNAFVYIPSGAISGVDALKAAAVSKINSVTLTTRKHPASFKGVSFVEKQKIDLGKLKEDKVLFSGSALQAVKLFPQNINVAAVLSIAGLGARNTKVKIIASPAVKKNIHEIRIVSRAADILTRTENILHPDNPKTSYLAVLSAIATLRQILQPVKIGT